MNDINNKKYYFSAFGLILCSEIFIPQIQQVAEQTADVIIYKNDLSEYSVPYGRTAVRLDGVYVSAENVGTFRITGGNLIEADILPDCTDSHMSVFLLGSCMGAILHQRGYMPLHGSCVTKGSKAVLITGDSGAGKSTTASEFLSHGWKLLTDDVAAVKDVESLPVVQSSYPSQKLWQDSLDQYKKDTTKVHSLYARDDEEKYGIDVSDMFYKGTAPLSLIVRLVPADAPTQIEAITGITEIDQLMRNTYRSFMILPENRNRHFQRCATLSTKVPMALVVRNQNEQCAEEVYRMIINYMENMENE